jgi:class 3 adenylate cyclase
MKYAKGLFKSYAELTMTHPDCISNRNLKIIDAYVKSRLGQDHNLFEGLPRPEGYPSAESFFLNEDQWTSYDNFSRVFRRARKLVGEADFFFNCGLSSAQLRSWGRFHYFVRVFASPGDGYKKLPFFNKNFNDTKEIEIIRPPHYDSASRKIKTLLKISFHDDFDPNLDYIGDAFMRGILSSIPTIWNLPPAKIEQTLFPYDPVVVFNQDPEFVKSGLDVRVENGFLSLQDPATGNRVTVGKEVLLEPENINGKTLYRGRYKEFGIKGTNLNYPKAILITERFSLEGHEILRKGTFFKAPYCILDVSFDRMSARHRISEALRFNKNKPDTGHELSEIIDQLRETIKDKNQANVALEKANRELCNARDQLDLANRELEAKVVERTAELERAQQDLTRLNDGLEKKVKEQLIALKRHDQLRRYLSPNLAKIILDNDGALGTEPERKLLTIVFTDIRGFSNLTDSLEPEELFQLLSRYFSAMIEIVHEYDGTLNKIVGDGLLVFFGDPVPMEDHAERAVKMAIKMQQTVAQLKQKWNHYGHDLGVGIGINTGYVTVGNVGSDIHRDYTIIGNQVNVASRLENLAKAGEILISGRTLSLLNGSAKVKELGDIQVKGIHNSVKTYRVHWQ